MSEFNVTKDSNDNSDRKKDAIKIWLMTGSLMSG